MCVRVRLPSIIRPSTMPHDDAPRLNIIMHHSIQKPTLKSSPLRCRCILTADCTAEILTAARHDTMFRAPSARPSKCWKAKKCPVRPKPTITCRGRRPVASAVDVRRSETHGSTRSTHGLNDTQYETEVLFFHGSGCWWAKDLVLLIPSDVLVGKNRGSGYATYACLQTAELDKAGPGYWCRILLGCSFRGAILSFHQVSSYDLIMSQEPPSKELEDWSISWGVLRFKFALGPFAIFCHLRLRQVDVASTLLALLFGQFPWTSGRIWGPLATTRGGSSP